MIERKALQIMLRYTVHDLTYQDRMLAARHVTKEVMNPSNHSGYFAVDLVSPVGAFTIAAPVRDMSEQLGKDMLHTIITMAVLMTNVVPDIDNLERHVLGVWQDDW